MGEWKPILLGADVVPAAEAPLLDSGLDSLSASELATALERELSASLQPLGGSGGGVTMPATLVFDYPTVGAHTRPLFRTTLEFVHI